MQNFLTLEGSFLHFFLQELIFPDGVFDVGLHLSSDNFILRVLVALWHNVQGHAKFDDVSHVVLGLGRNIL